MAKELIVSVNGREKKIAIIENEKVTEFYIERGEGNQGIVGNIYKGRVMRVLPGMQSAFVDIGLERDAFLYVSDFFDEEEEFERIVMDKSKKGKPKMRSALPPNKSRWPESSANATSKRRRNASNRCEGAVRRRELESKPRPTEEQPKRDNKRRGRRGRRRGRRQRRLGCADGNAVAPERTRITPEEIDTPFVAADPSVHRIVDEEEMLRSTARCLRTRACRNDSSIKFMPANSIWKTTFARLKSAQ